MPEKKKKKKPSTKQQRRIGKRSRTKGARYKTKIAKRLGKWWCDDPKAFKGTPRSGGWDKEKAPGDIYDKTETFPFTVECKHYKEWDFATLLKSSKSPLYGFWDQSAADAKISGREPCVIFSRNFDVDYLMCRRSLFGGLIQCRGAPGRVPHFIVVPPEDREQMFGRVLVILLLSTFLENFTPEVILDYFGGSNS